MIGAVRCNARPAGVCASGLLHIGWGSLTLDVECSSPDWTHATTQAAWILAIVECPRCVRTDAGCDR